MEANHENMVDLFTGYQSTFRGSFESAEEHAEYQRLAMTVRSRTSRERYPWLGQFPRVREWVGERVFKMIESKDFLIKNRKFEDGVAFERTDIEDDQYGLYGTPIQGLGVAAAEWPNDMVYDVLKNGETAVGYDDQPLFSATHPNGDLAAISNLTAGGGTPWYLIADGHVMKPIIFQTRLQPEFQHISNPESDHVVKHDTFLFGIRIRGGAAPGMWQTAHKSMAVLNSTNFDAAYQAMMQIKNDENRSIGIRPTLLVVPPSLRAEALELIQVQRLASGASNRNYRAVDVHVTPLLAA